MTPIRTLSVKNLLGESPLWDPRLQALWWTDVEGRQLYNWDWMADEPEQFDVPVRLTAIGLTTNSYELICAFEDGFAYFRPRTKEQVPVAAVDQQGGLVRMNDGRIGPDGRFWSGSMADGLKQPGVGQLFSLTGDSLKAHLEGITISNGICWSPDGGTMYFADTMTRKIHAFDYEDGQISNGRLFIKTEKGRAPDGAVTDTQGGYWSAMWGAGRVIRYDAQGRESLQLPVPTTQTTCPAWVGPELKHLAVTSARLELPGGVDDEQAGNLFIFETDYQGLAEPLFGLGRET